MIRNETEYREAIKRLEAERAGMAAKRRALREEGYYSERQIERMIFREEAALADLEDEISWYRNAKMRRHTKVGRLTAIGELLIATRIAKGISQRELARRLGVSETAVSRDERTLYEGVTVERAQRVFDMMGVGVRVELGR